jgi:nucleoside-triphosphatase THEP1
MNSYRILAEKAYEAYRATIGSGMVTWDRLTEHVQQAWENVARAVIAEAGKMELKTK